MTILLLQIGIVLVPFYDIILRIFPYVMITSDGTRPQRDIIALWVAIIISLYGLYKGKIKAENDKWLLGFLGFMFIVSFQFASGMSFVINGVQANSFWLWRPMFQSLCYFLAYLTIINTEFTLKEIDRILKTIGISAIVMSVYVFLQYHGIDQFFAVKPEILNAVQKVTNPQIGGTLGQPTLVAPMIALSIPILFYLKWEIHAIFSIVVLYLINSQVAIGASFFSLMAYSLMKKPQSWVIWTIILSSIACFLYANPSYIGDNGRFAIWSQIILDWSGTPFAGAKTAITGAGIGSFQYLFHHIHKSVFYQAHNEYAEVLYWGGIIGIGLFMAVLFNIYSRAFRVFRSHIDKRMSLMVALISSFICICLCAGGTFIWQLGVYRIFTVIILGIMLNNGLKRGIA